MMQLVTSGVSILNPTKDNLVLDAAKVEEVLGVPPERVVDVMALRGDSVDNIPGAPGIGDKGSVELIQQFGSVEAALDRAAEVKKKTYRESLQNNRENILLSKELVTIHTTVPIEYTLDAMRTQPVDNAACRELFSELEFTTLLKELAPAVDNTPIAYNLKPSPEEIAALLAEAREEGEGTARGFPSSTIPRRSRKRSPPNPPTKPSNPNPRPPKPCPSSAPSLLFPLPFSLFPRLSIPPAASALPSLATPQSRSRSMRPESAKRSKTPRSRKICTT
jgi:DNA polymerase-1